MENPANQEHQSPSEAKEANELSLFPLHQSYASLFLSCDKDAGQGCRKQEAIKSL